MEQDVQNKELIEAETQDTDSVVVTETVEHDENTSVIATIDKAEEKPLEKQKKKSKAFKIGVIVYSSILLVTAIATLVVLWLFLDSFEKSESQPVAERTLESVDKKQWLEFLKSNIYVSDYEDIDAATEIAYNKFIAGKDLVVRRHATECNDNTEVYNINNGDRNICKLVLKISGEGAFGFERWAFDSFEASDRSLNDVNKAFTVLLPAEGTLYINGVTADISDAKSSPCPFGALGEDEPEYLLCSFKELWGECELKADYQGCALVLKEDDGADYVYEIPDNLRHSCTVTVPAGTELYVNGERVSTDYITESNAQYPYISPLEAELETAPKSTVYKVEGLYDVPQIKAIYKGEELSANTDGNNHIYPLPYEFVGCSILVPNDATVTINGITLGREYITESNILYKEVAEYADVLVNAKTLCKYRVDGLFFKPEIAVTDSFGSPCELTRTADDEYCCNAAPSPELIGEYDRFTGEFAVAMVEYSMEGRDYVSENFSQVLSYTGYESNAYNVISDSFSAMYWQMNHTLTYNDLYTDNYISYADNAFTCDIHFDVVGERISFPGRFDYSTGIYKVLCIETNGNLEIMELSIETPDNTNKEDS